MPINYTKAGMKRPGVVNQWTEEQVKEMVKCGTNITHFAEKYYTIVHPKRGQMLITLHDFQKEMLHNFQGYQNNVVLSARQVGKALSLDTDILTPNGFVKLGNLKKGDVIFGRDGKKTVITFITETMFDRDVYKLTFDNGEEIKADAEHLWCIELNGKDEIKTTLEILNEVFGKKEIRIRKANKLQDSDYVVESPIYDDGYFYVYNINKIESEPVRCLQVDNEDHLFLCGKSLIPTHNTTCAGIFILWYSLFNDDKFVAVLANKQLTAKSIIDEIKFAYERLPDWLKPGVVEYNALAIKFDNGTEIMAAPTSPDAIRGQSVSLLFCLGGENTVEVKNKQTGEIKTISLEELYSNNHYN